MSTIATRPSTLRLGLLRARLELTQFLRGREAVVFTLAFPVILLVIFGAALNRDIAPGVKFVQYFVAGMVAAGILGTSFQNLAIQIPIDRDTGTLKRLAGTPMPKASYFIGKVLMVLALAAAEVVLLLVVGRLLYGITLPGAGKWLTFAWVGVLGVTACTLCGIAFSSLVRTGRTAPAIVSPVAIVLQFISGVFFVYTDLPKWMQTIGAVFPLKWMAQGMRSVFLPNSFAANEPTHSWELGRVALVLAAWAIGAFVLCVATFRWKSGEDG
jgi:ABC-2 type transport system permease protein